MPKIKAGLLLILLINPLFAIQQSGEVLLGDFWFPLDFFPPGTFNIIYESGYANLTAQQFNALSGTNQQLAIAAAHIFEEARFVFSGILFGFTYSYTPGDIRRQVAEEFTLTPRQIIPIGDPALQIIETNLDNNTFYIRIRYHNLNTFFFANRNSVALQRGQGRGYANIAGFTGDEARLAALQDSARAALDGHLRRLLPTRPLRVSGELFLNDVPRLMIESGRYVAVSRVSFTVNEVTPHRIH
ncbi:MAG: hypothetical protein FWE37_05510 [Spirochaetaceae bacterium]|nr:hypothetical protein [Spirochaetaceae bacterium]